MKTVVYIDGFNLFYGCLKGTNDKWLDLVKLSNKILKEQHPSIEIVKIKFFTANILSRFSSKKDAAHIAQQSYHRALEHLYPEDLEIIKGDFSCGLSSSIKYSKPVDTSEENRVFVWKLEEKKSDVAIALNAYRDVSQGQIDQVVFITNDSDMEPALEFIRQDFGERCLIGLIAATRKPTDDRGHGMNYANKSLSNLADWTRSYITDDELSGSQLDEKIPTMKRPIEKPDYW